MLVASQNIVGLHCNATVQAIIVILTQSPKTCTSQNEYPLCFIVRFGLCTSYNEKKSFAAGTWPQTAVGEFQLSPYPVAAFWEAAVSLRGRKKE